MDPVLDDHHFLPNGGSRKPEIMPNGNPARSLFVAVGSSQTRFVSGVLEELVVRGTDTPGDQTATATPIA